MTAEFIPIADIEEFLVDFAKKLAGLAIRYSDIL